MFHPLSGQSRIVVYILDLDRFAMELALTAANQNNCHIMAAEVAAILCLTTIVASSSRSRPGPDRGVT